MNIYRRKHSEIVFNRCVTFCCSDSQGWCPAYIWRYCSFLLVWRLQREKTWGENLSNDPSQPASGCWGHTPPQSGLIESVSDNCSITCPVGQLVWKEHFMKDVSLKKWIKLEMGHDERYSVAGSQDNRLLTVMWYDTDQCGSSEPFLALLPP